MVLQWLFATPSEHKHHVCFLRCLCGTLKIRKILLHYRVIPTNQHNGFLKVLVHILPLNYIWICGSDINL